MEQNIAIPIQTLIGGTLKASSNGDTFAPFDVTTIPGGVGGGADNLDDTSAYGWPEDCGATADCVGAGICTYGDWQIGQQYPLGAPDPARQVRVTSVHGYDKTSEVGGPFGVHVTGGVITSWFHDIYCGLAMSGIWEPGDVITVPGGTLTTDSWNANNDATGHSDASLEINIPIQLEWLDSYGLLFDTSPLYINIADIICVRPLSTTQVGIISRLPNKEAGTTGEYIIEMAWEAPTAMSLVNCVNRTLKEAAKAPLSNPEVNWDFSYSNVTVGPQYADNYQLNLDATV